MALKESMYAELTFNKQHTHVKLITRPTLKPEIRRHAEPYSHVCEIVAN